MARLSALLLLAALPSAHANQRYLRKTLTNSSLPANTISFPVGSKAPTRPPTKTAVTTKPPTRPPTKTAVTTKPPTRPPTKTATTKPPTLPPVTTKLPTSSTIVQADPLPKDLPPPEIGFEAGTGSTAEIPQMEAIPEWILAQTQGDIIDTPDAPVQLSSGSVEENLILERTASVCATSQQDAFNQCKAWPVCKYLLDSAGRPTTIKPDQGKCVPRCDAPLGAANCGSRQQCYPYVLACVSTGWN